MNKPVSCTPSVDAATRSAVPSVVVYGVESLPPTDPRLFDEARRDTTLVRELTIPAGEAIVGWCSPELNAYAGNHGVT